MDKINWLLLRGLAREVKHWGEFTETLKTQPYCQNMLALDLPGIGTEANKTAPLTISANCDDLRKRWLKYKAEMPGPWGLIAISLGAMIGMDWLCRFNDDFSLAVLINASARNVSPLHHRIRPTYLYSGMKAILNSDPEEREKALLQITSNLKCDDPAALKLWIAIARENPTKLSTFWRQLLAGAKFKAPKKIKVPLLFLSSEADRMVDFRSSQKLSEIYNAGLALHSSAGHDLPLDDPEWVLERVGGFVLNC